MFIQYSLLCLDDLVSIIKEFHGRVFKLEGDKWDLERGIKIRLLEVLFSSADLPELELELSGTIKPPGNYCHSVLTLHNFFPSRSIEANLQRVL